MFVYALKFCSEKSGRLLLFRDFRPKLSTNHSEFTKVNDLPPRFHRFRLRTNATRVAFSFVFKWEKKTTLYRTTKSQVTKNKYNLIASFSSSLLPFPQGVRDTHDLSLDNAITVLSASSYRRRCFFHLNFLIAYMSKKNIQKKNSLTVRWHTRWHVHDVPLQTRSVSTWDQDYHRRTHARDLISVTHFKSHLTFAHFVMLVCSVAKEESVGGKTVLQRKLVLSRYCPRVRVASAERFDLTTYLKRGRRYGRTLEKRSSRRCVCVA